MWKLKLLLFLIRSIFIFDEAYHTTESYFCAGTINNYILSRALIDAYVCDHMTLFFQNMKDPFSKQKMYFIS